MAWKLSRKLETFKQTKLLTGITDNIKSRISALVKYYMLIIGKVLRICKVWRVGQVCSIDKVWSIGKVWKIDKVWRIGKVWSIGKVFFLSWCLGNYWDIFHEFCSVIWIIFLSSLLFLGLWFLNLFFSDHFKTSTWLKLNAQELNNLKHHEKLIFLKQVSNYVTIFERIV